MSNNRIRELELELEIEEAKNKWKNELADSIVPVIFFLVLGITFIMSIIFQTPVLVVK